MSNHDLHHEWLALIEISGPFLAVPVLKEAFPQGLEELDGLKRKRLRQAYEEWRDALETDDPQFTELHAAWIDEVLTRGLDLDEDGKGDVLKRADWCAANLNVSAAEHCVTLAPDFAVIDEQRAGKPLLLIHTYGPDVDLNATLKLDRWAVTPADRMVQLCRATDCRLGLVTNGERWMMIDAPVGAVTSFASWYARIWLQEPITLQAFVHLLGIRRFFVDEPDQLPALFERSLKYQDEVTDALGEQVRRAVEVLIQALDKADQDRDRALLRDVKEPVLYEAALTVMMRLVFLLSAEERGLLLLGDERYEANYAISTLRMQLRKESEDILEHRWDAWSRLLAIFRAVFGGIEHESMRLPALGGSLFDPDRFPFLEGRARRSHWRTDIAKPLPIDNRTVLLLLESIQQFQGRTLSYRALDVEQIGYVYEGLLERTVKRTAEVTLELDGTKAAKAPLVKLAELESARLDGSRDLVELLQERSGSSASRVRNDLAKPVDDTLADRLLAACHGNTVLRDRIKPFTHLVRTDPWGYPLVYPAGAFIVATSSDRRETGTHYTPKSLTEAIVAETLTPITYLGPAEGTPREQWLLKSPAELLGLKICDPAMGSGAFLVQACRWLADRLVEAWFLAEATGRTVSVDGEVLDSPNTREPLPRDTVARTIIARSLIAERCLYGVDLNPLAVELAKLSIWLVTLAKGRPFGFLDHNLRCGDSLLGIHRLDQLTELSMTPTGKGQQHLFAQNIERSVHEAIEVRQRLREMPIRDIHDVESMAQLDVDARRKIEVPERIADAFIGEVFVSKGNTASWNNAIASLAIQAGQAIDGDLNAIASITERARTSLGIDISATRPGRRPFHWPLEFPEVFAGKGLGFDSIIGNPPFLGGTRISGALGGRFRDYLADNVAKKGGGQADLVAYFFIQSTKILASEGCLGLLATNSIAEGDTRQVGLESLLEKSGVAIICAYPNEAWPGKAAVVTSRVHIKKGTWRGRANLSGKTVDYISAFLSDADEWSLKALAENANLAFEGSYTFGDGFTVDPEEVRNILTADPNNRRVLFPYINGKELNSDPNQMPGRWVINFFDWPEDEAIKYSLPYKKILQDVKEERANTKNQQVREYPWWLHWRPRPGLYHAIGRGSDFRIHPKGWRLDFEKPAKVLVSCRVSKHPIFCFVPNEYVYSNAINVFALASFFHFSVLQSSIHSVFVWKYASKMKNDIRYTPGDVFMPFPWPASDSFDDLEVLGCAYHAIRSSFLSASGIGLTKFYNLFHARENETPAMNEVRATSRSIDNALMRAYGWEDIDLGHDFHEVPYLPENDRVRFTISEVARLEVLSRLAVLNRQRYEAEVAGGTVEGAANIGKPRKRSQADAPLQLGMDFDN